MALLNQYRISGVCPKAVSQNATESSAVHTPFEPLEVRLEQPLNLLDPSLHILGPLVEGAGRSLSCICSELYDLSFTKII